MSDPGGRTYERKVWPPSPPWRAMVRQAHRGPGGGPAVATEIGDTRTAADVAVEHVWKSFDGLPVLRGVDMTIRGGEVHALAGANGSGKSTIVKILAGNYRPDSGTIVLRGGRRAAITSPREARELGVRVVHQEAPLIDTMSVGECMALFRRYQVGRGGRIQWRSVYRQAGAVLAELGISVDPRALAASLPPSDRALVSLAIALGGTSIGDTSLVILDEASAAIPEKQAGEFLQQVRKLAEQGLPILMVTHRLNEVSAFADRVTVVDDGVVAYQGPVGEISFDELVALISGTLMRRQAAALRSATVPPGVEKPEREPTGAPRQSARTKETSEPILKVEDLTTRSLRKVAFVVAAGEVLGVVGGPQSGIEELPLALVGAIDGVSGQLFIEGVPRPMPRSPRQALREGIALVPRDRLRDGAVGSLSIYENVLLPKYRRYWHRGSLGRRTVAEVIEELAVTPPLQRTLVRELSGGNQQKVILGKWLSCNPRALILDDPTYGIDPAARETIFQVVKRRAAEAGMGVLLLSTEPEQLVEHCARVIAVSGGRIVEELKGNALSHASMARWAAT